MYIPSAVSTSDGTFRFGFNYNPHRYALSTISGQRLLERVLFANLTLLPRLDINVTLIQAMKTNFKRVNNGIGDRQLDLRYLILKETPKRPSVAIVVSTPFAISAFMLTHVIVATKHFELNEKITIEASAGYGSPYYLSREVQNLDNSGILSGYLWQRKGITTNGNLYLVGPFGGIILHYKKQAGLMLEYDSQHINVGAYATLFKHWTVQAGLLNGDQVMFGTSFGANLLKLPKQIRKK